MSVFNAIISYLSVLTILLLVYGRVWNWPLIVVLACAGAANMCMALETWLCLPCKPRKRIQEGKVRLMSFECPICTSFFRSDDAEKAQREHDEGRGVSCSGKVVPCRDGSHDCAIDGHEYNARENSMSGVPSGDVMCRYCNKRAGQA